MLKKLAPVTVLALSILGCSTYVEEGTPSPSPIDDPTPTPVVTPTPSPTPAPDADADGSPDSEDCDDLDDTIYPGASEILCDGKDQDCDGADGAAADHLVCQDGSCNYSSIDNALDSMSGDGRVMLCPGTYRESNLTIDGKRILIKGVGSAEETIIDAGGKNQSVIRILNLSNTGDYGVENLTLTGSAVLLSGGGLFINSASPVIRHTIIRDNTAVLLGAGAYLLNSNASFEYVSFKNNSSSDDGGGAFIATGRPVFDQCIFENNAAGDVGGALSLDSASPTINNSLFRGNTAVGGGGAIEAQYVSTPLIQNSLFVANHATFGHVLYTNDADAHPEFQFSVLVGNGASEEAPPARTAPQAEPGTVVIDAGSLTMSGSVLAFNSGCNISLTTGVVTLTSSDLYAPEGCNTAGLTLDEGILTVDPMFLTYDEVSGMPTNFHLALGAPLVDVGPAGFTDVDGSASDIGLYGGPYGDDFDRDQDGLPDYFWPGLCSDAPVGVDSSGYDCDDLTVAEE